eukprot:518244-Pelagomonas_calceolata.AAC.2
MIVAVCSLKSCSRKIYGKRITAGLQDMPKASSPSAALVESQHTSPCLLHTDERGAARNIRGIDAATGTLTAMLPSATEDVGGGWVPARLMPEIQLCHVVKQLSRPKSLQKDMFYRTSAEPSHRVSSTGSGYR